MRVPSILPLCLLPLLTLGACRVVPQRFGDDVRELPASGLNDVNPSDVVVMPVLDVTGEGLPEETLRASFHDLLPRKRYVPVRLGYVDERLIEASYSPGACQEDAVLEIVVHRWGNEHWELRSALDVDIEVRMLDASSERAEPLWASRLDRRFDFGGAADTFVSDRLRLEHACDTIALELLSTLPARRTEPEPLLDGPAAQSEEAPEADSPELEPQG